MTTDKHSSPSRLSSDLEALHARVQGKSLTVEELKQALKGRGTAMLLVVLALPFCFVAIPGLFTPFGIAISLIGARLLIGREPWLPCFNARSAIATIPVGGDAGPDLCLGAGLFEIQAAGRAGMPRARRPAAGVQRSRSPARTVRPILGFRSSSSPAMATSRCRSKR